MRKRTHMVLLVLICLLCTGCAGIDFWHDIPRDYALSQEVVESTLKMEDLPEEEAPQVNFLMEEIYPYARSTLSQAEQIWYQDMEDILGSFGEEKKLSKEGLDAGLDESSIDKIFQCVLSDHPELFYVDGYSYTKYSRGETLTAVEFSGSYNVDLDTAVKREEMIRLAAERILAGISAETSEYEKVKYVYDTLIRQTDYDLNAADNQNIYSVFANHTSVCQGYAKATQYLLNKLGVECTLVLGTVETGEGHAWNLVKVDGDFYYVDTTWGDVSYQMEEASSEEGAEPNADRLVMPEINYDYLNVTTAELLRTHSIGGQVPMPVCVATEANYYVREGGYFSSYDQEQMAELFRRAAESGRRDVTIKCGNESCYREIVDGLIDGQEIFRYLTDEEGKIAYAQNEKQLSLTFWVTNE
nr:transglutaminase domain-containing protein [uncultured Acetatifactor sp.]